MGKILFVFIALLFTQCATKRERSTVANYSHVDFTLDTLTLNDFLRNRAIPIAIYQQKDEGKRNGIPIIFSHGYGENKGGDYLYAYTYLTEYLASKGYTLVSVQHELPNDDLLAMTGVLKETRMPNWERGSQNIFYVLHEIKTKYPKLSYSKLVLIGHSNGGDMTALFVHLHPELVGKVITMDNRRMPLPRTEKPKIYTLRSNDHPADEQVLPTDLEVKIYAVRIEFTDINHNNMDNDATAVERKYLTNRILQYLEE